MRTYFSKEPLQCPFLLLEASEAIPALMVSLMPISREMESADCALMGWPSVHINHFKRCRGDMQSGSYFWAISFWELHVYSLCCSCSFLLCTPFFLLCFLCIAMVAALVQFQLLTSLQECEWSATNAWLQGMRLREYAADP